VRNDGREYDQMREMKIERNYVKPAEGSCLIELGQTRLICTATVEEGVPQFLKGKGTGWVRAEYGMLPRSTLTRNQRDKLSGRRFEIQRLIGRSLRAGVELEKLGERTIWIDCDVIQADGGTRTAAINGGFIALVDCLIGLKKKGVLKEVPIKSYLGAISVGIWKKNLVLDLNYLEDSKAEVDMNVVMNSQKELVEIQATAEESSFSPQIMLQMVDLAQGAIERIIEKEKEFFRDEIFF